MKTNPFATKTPTEIRAAAAAKQEERAKIEAAAKASTWSAYSAVDKVRDRYCSVQRAEMRFEQGCADALMGIRD